MALNLTKSFTFAPNTVIASSEVNTDLDTLYNAFIGLEAGTSSMSKLPLDTDPTSALYAATKQYVDTYASYGRPTLVFSSVTKVVVEENTGTSNQTKILFPDGNLRTVTEDPGVTNKYRVFDITATAEFTSGTEDSGIRSGISEANNTWYAIYAVKSLINSSNFVLAGDTTLPLRSAFSTLNSRYGTNSWVYLGMIRNGDGGTSNADILSFFQSGGTTMFSNLGTGHNNLPVMGILLATSASATTLTYTWANGTGSAEIPDNIGHVHYSASAGAAATTFSMNTQINSQNTVYSRLTSTATAKNKVLVFAPATAGVNLTMGSGTTMDIGLEGFVDFVLGVGSNPLVGSR